MRLLPKKEVSIEASKQKKLLIDEGLKLATTVDALRETKVKEEGNLNRFRTETIASVQHDIDLAIAKRNVLQVEIAELEKEREIQQLPFDDEWEKIRLTYIKYADQIGTLESAKETIAKQLGENTLKAEELAREEGRIVEMKRLTEENLFHSEDDLQNARAEAERVKSLAQSVLQSAEAREKLVIQREKEYQATVDWCESEKERLEFMRTDLTKREKKLKDNFALLERTKKRK